MSKLLISAIGLLLMLTSFKSDQLPQEFSELLKRSDLVFNAPEGFKPVKPIPNGQMNYEYAIHSKDKKFEVRYAIRPMEGLLVEYEKAIKRGDVMIHPNNIGPAAYQTTLLNIGIGGPNSGQMPNFQFFDSTAVKEEFNADRGMSAFTTLGKEFGQDYQYCLALMIQKNNKANAYIFFLSKEQEIISQRMKSVFYTLKFQK